MTADTAVSAHQIGVSPYDIKPSDIKSYKSLIVNNLTTAEPFQVLTVSLLASFHDSMKGQGEA